MSEFLPALIGVVAMVALFEWLLHELRRRPSLLRQLERELRSNWQPSRALARVLRFRLPVYSAETVRGREAEFIRDPLPVKHDKRLLFIALLVLLGALLFAVAL